MRQLLILGGLTLCLAIAGPAAGEPAPGGDARPEAPAPEPRRGMVAPEFYETDLRTVLRYLKRVSGWNFAVDPDVSGTVTLSFDHPVPWETVLRVVLKMNGLAMETYGSQTIHIFRKQ